MRTTASLRMCMPRSLMAIGTRVQDSAQVGMKWKWSLALHSQTRSADSRSNQSLKVCWNWNASETQQKRDAWSMVIHRTRRTTYWTGCCIHERWDCAAQRVVVKIKLPDLSQIIKWWNGASEIVRCKNAAHKSEIENQQKRKTLIIQPQKSNDLHFLDVDRKLGDRSSESIVLRIAAKRQRTWKKLNRSFLQAIETRRIGIGLWDSSWELVVAQIPCAMSARNRNTENTNQRKQTHNQTTNLQFVEKGGVRNGAVELIVVENARRISTKQKLAR